MLLKKSILEELPIRDTIFNINNLIIKDNESFQDHLLSKEIDIIESCRSILLNTLNNLIIKFGQDLKNEQWVLEPLADMVISFSVMHLGFLRYNILKDKIKQLNTLPILRSSLSRNLDILLSKCKLINNYMYNEIDAKDENSIIDSKINSLNWYVDNISLEQMIAETFLKEGKYYLD